MSFINKKNFFCLKFLSPPFLKGLAIIYGVIVRIRLFLFQNRILSSRESSSVVVSVGNLTVGGTGKTPLVHFLNNFFAEKNIQPAILSRGYSSAGKGIRVLSAYETPNPSICGDEPAMLSRLCPNAKIYVCPNRRKSSALAEKKHSVLILDDGFQHLRLKRDIDLVIIDCISGMGNLKLLPEGILREPIAELKRADAILLSKANLGKRKQQILNQIQFLNNTPIFESTNYIEFFLDRQDQKISAENMKKNGILLLSAIGKPNGFEKLLEFSKIRFSKHLIYPDHYQYSSKDIKKISETICIEKFKFVITTEKDWVKLSSFRFPVPVFRARMGIQVNSKFLEYFNQKIKDVWKQKNLSSRF